MFIMSTQGTKERVSRLVKMHANKREEIARVRAGDIGAVVGIKDAITGDTICAMKVIQYCLKKLMFLRQLFLLLLSRKIKLIMKR